MFLLTLLFGFLGTYRFYKKDYILGVIYLFTGGIFGLGWIYDIYCAAKEYSAAIDNSQNLSVKQFGINQKFSIDDKGITFGDTTYSFTFTPSNKYIIDTISIEENSRLKLKTNEHSVSIDFSPSDLYTIKQIVNKINQDKHLKFKGNYSYYVFREILCANEVEKVIRIGLTTIYFSPTSGLFALQKYKTLSGPHYFSDIKHIYLSKSTSTETKTTSNESLMTKAIIGTSKYSSTSVHQTTDIYTFTIVVDDRKYTFETSEMQVMIDLRLLFEEYSSVDIEMI